MLSTSKLLSTFTYGEMNTILIEVESMVNARPITYVYDDNESVSYPLTLSDLIYGRKITSMPNSSHFEVVSTNHVLTRRARHHRNLLRQFTNTPNRISITVGGIVLLKSDSTSRNVWKVAKIDELIAGKE